MKVQRSLSSSSASGRKHIRWQAALAAVLVGLLFLVWAAGSGQAQGPEGSSGPPQQAALQDGPQDLGIESLLGTAFTYQGKLLDGGSPANGVYDFRFSLFDALAAGNQLGSTIPVDNQTVTSGLFTVKLDYGPNLIVGDARWLEIQVKRDADVSYITLTPRVELTPSPHALALPGLWTQQNATSPNLIGGYSGNSVTAGVVGAAISGGGNSGALNHVTDNYGAVGGGTNNWAGDNAGLTDDKTYATVGGGASNQANGHWSTIGGGYLNWANAESAVVAGGYMNFATATEGTVAGGHNNQVQAAQGAIVGGTSNLVSGQYGMVGGGYLNSASASYGTVGGGNHNTLSGNSATIAGGAENDALCDYSAIGGGYNNQTNSMYMYQTIAGGTGNSTSDTSSTVGGGNTNQASGGWSTVSGGYHNTATGDYATIGGGGGSSSFPNTGNTASGDYSTVSGGGENTASGAGATVPGGLHNVAAGAYSFAAGQHATASNGGCFVWSDNSVGGSLSCTVSNRWLARTSGGIYFYTSSGTVDGVYMLYGDNSWRPIGFRQQSENLAPVDTDELLRRLSQVPVMTWNNKTQGPSFRHIGLSGSEFNSLVDGLGGDNQESISSLDADGVALAAIQGLYKQVQEKDARIAALEQQNADLEARVEASEQQNADLEGRVEALEQATGLKPAAAARSYGPPLVLGAALAAVVVYSRRRSSERGGQE